MTMDEWNEKNKNSAGAFATEEKPVNVQGNIDTSGKGNVAVNDGSQPISVNTDASEMTGNLALILGILSIIFGLFFGGAPWIGIFMGIAAVVLGVVEKKKKNPLTKKTATAGFVCGIVGISLSVFMGLFCLALGIAIRTIGGILKFIF